MERGGFGGAIGGIDHSCFAAGRHFLRAVEEERLPVKS